MFIWQPHKSRQIVCVVEWWSPDSEFLVHTLWLYPDPWPAALLKPFPPCAHALFPVLFWLGDCRGRWWEQRTLAFPSHSPDDCCGARSPPLASTPSSLATTNVGKAWEGVPASTLSAQTAVSGSKPTTMALCTQLQHDQSSWPRGWLMTACFVSVFFAVLFHLASDQTQHATQVAVGVSEVELHQWLVTSCNHF